MRDQEFSEKMCIFAVIKTRKENAMKEEETLRPYTKEELLERAEEGRRQIALGNYSDIEDVLRELDEEFDKETPNTSPFIAAEEMHYETV